MSRVLVCGGRDCADRRLLFATLDAIHASVGIAEVVHGGARGADELAGEWAHARGIIAISVYPADWKQHGPAAGPIRNRQMLRERTPDRVIAFPGGRGTADMVRQARSAGVEVVEVRERKEGA